jgi:hypothetical protein
MTHRPCSVAVALVLACSAACGASAHVDSAHVDANAPGDHAEPSTSAATSEPAAVAPEPAAAVTPELEAMLTAALRRDPRSTGTDYPGCPPLAVEVKRGVAREVAKSAAVREALELLDPEHVNVVMFDAVAALEREHAVFTLAAAVCHDSDDVKIKSARALAALADPTPLPFLLEVADRFAVFEDGSENATIHGVLQHDLAAALNAMTAEHVTLGEGQDPDALRAGIVVWRKHAAR